VFRVARGTRSHVLAACYPVAKLAHVTIPSTKRTHKWLHQLHTVVLRGVVRRRDHHPDPLPLQRARPKRCDETNACQDRVEDVAVIVSSRFKRSQWLRASLPSGGASRFCSELFGTISSYLWFSGNGFTHTRSAILVHKSLRRGVRFGSLNNGGHSGCRSCCGENGIGVALRYAMRTGYQIEKINLKHKR
jgi:hypothetical protein